VTVVQISEMREQKYEHPQTADLLTILKASSLVHEVLVEMEKVVVNKTPEPYNYKVSSYCLSVCGSAICC